MSCHLNKDSKVVIVGGGMAGMFAASVCLSYGVKDITIVEKSDSLGGLLKSPHYKNPLGDGNDYEFDLGTHFILKTGTPSIDALIEEDLNTDKFNEYTGSLPEGQYINGQLYPDSGCANATLFPADIFQKIKDELQETVDHSSEKKPENLLELFTEKYGEAAMTYIYKPAFKKFTGSDLADLDTSLENSYNSGRLIMASREEALEIKKKPEWDNVVAFSHYEDGSSAFNKCYPKKGGIEEWMDAMEKRLLESGVKIMKSSEIESISQEDQRITSVVLKNKENLQCDYLMWTLPPVFLAKMTGIDVPSMPPKMRSVSTVNFITDKKPISGPYWLVVYDSSLVSYRVTLYDNFAPNQSSDYYRVTVEVLHEGEFSGNEEECQKIFQEQIEMKILPEDAKLLWSSHEFIPAGFPVLKPGDSKIYDEQIVAVHQGLKNAHAVSRYRGGSHGQIAIMHDIYEALENCFVKKEAA